MERYAVQLVESGQIVSSWLQGMDTALLLATRFAKPAVVVLFSEWAPGRRLVAESIDFAMPDDVYPVVYDNDNGQWVMTGEIVSAQETRYQVTECGCGMFEPAEG